MAEAGEPINFQAYATKKEESISEVKPLELPQEVIDKLDQETLRHGQNECCGFVIEINGKMEVVAIKNTLINAQTPDQKYKRSHHAYEMDNDEVIKLHQRLEKEKGRMVALYHSHTSHNTAQFSGSDVTHALESGYKDIPYIVIATKDGKINDRRAHTHDTKTNTFTESKVIPLKPSAPAKVLPFRPALKKAA